jgi:hypothetical protein
MFLSKPIKECLAEAKKVGVEGKGKIRGMIVPHAGLMYSGVVAGAGYRLLKKGDYDKVIILGFLHGYLVEEEHSVEIQIPFIKEVLGEVKIAKNYGEKIDLEKEVDEKTLVIASSDLSHYLPQTEAEEVDKKTIDSILAMKCSSLEACGAEPIQKLNELAKARGWKPILVDYQTSGETTGDWGAVVGYTCIVYLDQKSNLKDQKLTKNLKLRKNKILLNLARRAIEAELKGEILKVDGKEMEEDLKEKRAAFVTLTISNNLRGCMGHLEAKQELYKEIIEDARAAAFKDPRFWPLTAEEFKQVKIEISILDKPKKFNYSTVGELEEYLSQNKPGVIIKDGWNTATFLPQVWEDLPKCSDFLGQLCLKAGLEEEEWKRGKLGVMTYGVEKIDEG